MLRLVALSAYRRVRCLGRRIFCALTVFRPKEKPDLGRLQVYDLATASLEAKLLSDAFAAHDLYSDASSAANVDEIASKMLDLDTGLLPVIEKMHTGANAVPLLRSELEALHKMVFIVHYRTEPVSETYLSPHDTGRIWAECYPWVHKMRMKTPGGQNATPTDLQLLFLQYFINTPHLTILDDCERWYDAKRERKRSGGYQPYFHQEDDETVASADYKRYMPGEDYVEGLWRAAPGREFILTSSSFGVPEGNEYAGEGLHRIFVLSPTMVLVWRSTKKRHPGDTRSVLYDIPITPPTRTASVARKLDPLEQLSTQEEISEYLAGQGQKDTISLGVTDLTPEQTDALNFVLLRNVHGEDSLSFVNFDAFTGTMVRFLSLERKKLEEHYHPMLYGPLVQRYLTKNHEEYAAPAYALPPDIHTHLTLLGRGLRTHFDGPIKKRSGWPIRKGAYGTEHRGPVTAMLALLATPFPSHYDRAYQLHTVLRDAEYMFDFKYDTREGSGFVSAYNWWTQRLQDAWLARWPAPPGSRHNRFRGVPISSELKKSVADRLRKQKGLKHTLSEEDGELLFMLIGAVVSNGVAPPPIHMWKNDSTTLGDVLMRFVAQAIYVGAAERVYKASPKSLAIVTVPAGLYGILET